MRTLSALACDIAGFTRNDYINALRASFDAQDWCACCTTRPIDGVVDELTGFGEYQPGGTLVGRCVDALVLLAEPD